MWKSIFHKEIDRSGTHSFKWGKTEELFGGDGLLPMWVADMDFQAPKAVINAFEKRINHGVFGYTFINDDVFEAVENWTRRRYNWKIDKKLLSFTESVVPAISSVIRSFTNRGDKIMIQAPVYAPFFEMIEKNDRIVINNQLKQQGNKYVVDFDHFEACLKQGVKLFILCNPHNPGSRVWSREELTKMGELCLQYDCLILADDIHADLVFSPAQYVPIASLNEDIANNVITCLSPSKAFNLAGLNAAVIIFGNQQQKEVFDYTQRKQGFFSVSMFGIIGLEVAYSEGEEWLDELLQYLQQNIKVAEQFINEHLPDIKMFAQEGTYLLWLDCRNLNLSDDKINELLLKKGKLALEPGQKYGPGGKGFVRMNIACPRQLLYEGLNRFKKSFK